MKGKHIGLHDYNVNNYVYAIDGLLDKLYTIQLVTIDEF